MSKTKIAPRLAELLGEQPFDGSETAWNGPAIDREFRALLAVAKLARSFVKEVWLEMDLAEQDDLDDALKRALSRLSSASSRDRARNPSR